jgi:hypothetical protein
MVACHGRDLLVLPAAAPPTTPRSVSAKILAFCHLFSRKKPVFLPYTETGGERLWCHLNADLVARRRGWRQVFGWIIWECPQTLRAVFHSVVEDRNGALLDITPPVRNEAVILFLPDPNRSVLMAETIDQGKECLSFASYLAPVFSKRKSLAVQASDAPPPLYPNVTFFIEKHDPRYLALLTRIDLWRDSAARAS